MKALAKGLCSGCGGHLSSDWIEALGRCWHTEHFACHLCGRTIAGQFVVVDGEPAHEACALEHRVPRCRNCAHAINGPYFKDIWGEVSCSACAAGGVCIYCGGAGRRNANSPDLLCKICRRLSINDQCTADAFYAEVIDWANSKNIFEYFKQPPMVLYSRERLSKEFPNSERLLGMAQKSIWETPAGASAKAERVVVIAGLPGPLFQAVAAHELGHVWVAANNLHNVPLRDEEGFCELLSHTWISERGTYGRAGMMRQIEASIDPIYGDGFRKMKAVEIKSNINYLMYALKKRYRINLNN